MGRRSLEGEITQHRRHKGGKEPAATSSLASPAGAIHLVMDTSKNTIVAATLMPGEEVPVIDRMWNEEGSVRHLVGRFADRAALRACYEAGLCGFELHRLPASMGWPAMWWRRR